MTQEDRELLLKDLCARLPYGVKTSNGYGILELTPRTDITYIINDGDIPFLRSISSMTEKERKELMKFGAITNLENGEVIDVSCVGFENHAAVQDYLNAHHFDYRGLIEKGLALEAPEGMYK